MDCYNFIMRNSGYKLLGVVWDEAELPKPAYQMCSPRGEDSPEDLILNHIDAERIILVLRDSKC